MPKICDRSPCDTLLGALGNYVFGSNDGFFMIVASKDKESEIQLDYCPFCGTRLEEVGSVVVEKFTRPRRRRAIKAPAA